MQYKELRIRHKAEITAIINCARQKQSILDQLECGIITPVDADCELEMITRKEKNIKKQLVLSVHITENGTPRTINYLEKQELWYTLVPGKQRITAKTEDALYDKLMVYYNLSLADNTVAGIFEAAMADKESSGITTFETHKRIRNDFTRYITGTFAKTDIRKVTTPMLKSYTADMLKDNKICLSAFKNYRIMLNTIFKYAYREGIVGKNPVDSILIRDYAPLCAITTKEDNDFTREEKEILSPDEISLLKEKIEWRINRFDYYPHGYAMLLAIETGMRSGEIPALKWTDIKEKGIHIHSQQLYTRENGKKEFYYVPWTKDEKRKLKKTGRIFPLTNAIKDILERIRANQEKLGLKSEYIFIDENGEPIHSDNYEKNIRKLFTSLGFTATHNHALRKSLNSNILIPLGVPATERARMLGHSVDTNLRYYSFAGKNTNDDICALLDSANVANAVSM